MVINYYLTELRAIDPTDGVLKTWGGPRIKGTSWDNAQKWCDENMGYLTVIGELVSEIDYQTDEQIDYDKYYIDGTRNDISSQ